MPSSPSITQRRAAPENVGALLAEQAVVRPARAQQRDDRALGGAVGGRPRDRPPRPCTPTSPAARSAAAAPAAARTASSASARSSVELVRHRGAPYPFGADAPRVPPPARSVAPPATVRAGTFPTPRSAPGAAGASCTSASRSTTSACSRCCGPAAASDTVLTADAYGAGEADALLGRALAGVPRDDYCLVGAIGHDFYEGEREGAKGFPRFTDPRLRGPDALRRLPAHGDRAQPRALRRRRASTCCCCTTPTAPATPSPAVWDGDGSAARRRPRRRCSASRPGPANGFTLDLIDCFERFGDADRLGDGDPQPARAVAGRARARRPPSAHGVKLITRVVDYGGLFHDDVLPGHAFAERDHRTFRPAGWVEAGPRAHRAHAPDRRAPRPDDAPARLPVEPRPRAGRCVVPTLIQEAGAGARPVEDKRAELAALPAEPCLTAPTRSPRSARSATTPAAWRSRAPSPDHEGEPLPDRWPLDARAGRARRAAGASSRRATSRTRCLKRGARPRTRRLKHRKEGKNPARPARCSAHAPLVRGYASPYCSSA